MPKFIKCFLKIYVLMSIFIAKLWFILFLFKIYKTILTDAIVEIEEALPLFILEQVEIWLDVGDLDIGLFWIQFLDFHGV